MNLFISILIIICLGIMTGLAPIVMGAFALVFIAVIMVVKS